ncbi:MAG: hypothetical protein IKR76_00395 [Ruminococcus sp.]|nr:hypothetical protein [Ruminococcus sp.]
MNFLFVGFALIIVNVNLSLWVTYALKTLGFVFAAIGIAEYSVHDDGVKAYSPNAVASAVMNGAFTAALIYASIKLDAKYINYAGIIAGVFSTLVSFDFQKRMMVRILRSGEGKVVEDAENHRLLLPFVADVKRLGRAWNRLTVTVALNLLFDVLNRLVKVSALVTVTGIAAAFTKVVCIVLAVVFIIKFNELRVGYEKTMDKLDNT